MGFHNFYNYFYIYFFIFFFKQKTAYEMLRSLVGSEMCIRDRFKSKLLKRYKFKDIIIVEAAGLSSVYANQGGIIVAF